MSADLDALADRTFTCWLMISCRADGAFGRPPRISDSELICLAVAQVLLDCPNERRFLRLAKRRLGHLFPYIPGQSGFNKRLRALAPQLLRGDHAAGPAVAVVLRPAQAARLDTGAVRRLARDRPPLSARRARRLRLLPLAQPLVLGLPPLPALRARRAADRLRARPRERTRTRSSPPNCSNAVLEPGQTVIADKGFAGAEFEQLVCSLGGRLLRPDRKDEPPRFGSLGGIRQWIESTFDTLKDQLSLERHGGRTLTGLISRIARRLLALTAAILHNWQLGTPGRNLTAYDH